MFFTSGDRFIHAIPGRMRLEIWGLKNNKSLARDILERFGRREGVLGVSPSVHTGRVLFTYDEKMLSPRDLINQVLLMEHEYRSQQQNVTGTLSSRPNNNLNDLTKTNESKEQPDAEVAAALQTTEPNLPMPLALTTGGLGLLGIKRLLSGRSALAQSSAAFNMAATVSVLSGYPLFKRGFQRIFKNMGTADFVLGASALGLALVRENVVVLAGLSFLQYQKWKKSQALIRERDHSMTNPEIRNYAEKAGKTNLVIAGTAWALTRNPLVGLGVLLAGNPRLAILPTEYAWDQAELVAKQEGYVIPEHGSLAELAHFNTLIVEDSSLLFNSQEKEIQCITNDEDHTRDVWYYAASIMKKTNHPWKQEVLRKAKSFNGTIRAAFKTETTEEGTQATINGKTIVLGSLNDLEQKGVNCDHYLIQVKRAQRQGQAVLCVAREGEFLGFLAKSVEENRPILKETVTPLIHNHERMRVLENSLNLDKSILKDYGIETEWLDLQETEIMENLAIGHQKGEHVLFISREESQPRPWSNAFPCISVDNVESLKQTIQYSKQIENLVQDHFRLAKTWNLMGTILAVATAITAPALNLITDAVSLGLISRSKRVSENPRWAKTPPKVPSLINLRQQSESPKMLPQGRRTEVIWHALSQDVILNRFNVNLEHGLTDEGVLRLRTQFGSNQLDRKKPVPWIVSYLSQFKEFTTLVILGTSVLALATGDIFDGLAIGSILLANAAIGTFQERKAERVIDVLNEYQPPNSKVIRDEQTLEISGTELVPGDIVYLAAGDRIPADLRLLRTWNLEVNEAALTGESLPVAKNNEVLDAELPLAERKNMLYMGTDITKGKGIGIVIGTGMDTEIGYLMSLLKGEEKIVTPLHEKVTSISKAFIKAAAISGGLVFIVGLLRGRSLTEMIATSITLAASAVPEGLPVTITIALSAGIFRMAKKNALVRKLSALETLGRTTVICTDKTGTLTKNEMTVKRIATVSGLWNVTGEGYEPKGSIVPLCDEPAPSSHEEDHPDLRQLAKIGLFCNNSSLLQEEDKWQIKGDPTEGALLSMAAKFGLRQEQMTHWHRVHEVPFDSNAGTMSVVCRDTQNDQDCFVFCKGSVEAVLAHCNNVLENGVISPLNEDKRRQILQQNDTFASDALRVLGFAYCPVEWVEDDPGGIDDELIYVGLVGMMDPPKPEVKESISEAYALGVKPVMITGDHPITALAIAKELGIRSRQTKVLTGQELDQLSDIELANVIEDVAIFARVTPEHKLRIVTAFQKRGHIVAMTGDGVNDTPAIKQSNVGIAMGQTGTEVTKATADMVLKKDHFGSILEGVKEGRTIIGNIRRAIGCLLTGNLAEILVTATSVLVGLPMPLVPIQILLMNLLTDAIPAMILAVNPGREKMQTERQDIVDKALYKKVITRGILLGATSLGLFGATLGTGAPLIVAQTVAFTSLVIGQFVQTLSWRQEGKDEKIGASFKDRYLVGGLGASLLVLMATLYIPSFAQFFHTAPLSLRHWLFIGLGAGLVSLLSKPFHTLVSSLRGTQLARTPELANVKAGILAA